MAEGNGVKIGYGKFENIDTAVEKEILDERDLVITKDTSELVYIKDDKTKQVIRSRVLRFDTKNEAIIELNKNSDTYAGQMVMIKGADGKYDSYIVQLGNSSFEVEPIVQMSPGGLTWVEF